MAKTESSIFLSFAAFDEAIARALRERLDAFGISVWSYIHESSAGETILRVIEQGLKACSHMLALISEASVKSSWCDREWSAALTSDIPLIPVLLDSCSLPTLLAGLSWLDLRDPNRLDEVVDKLLKQIRPDYALPPLPSVHSRDSYATAAGFTGRSREKRTLSTWLADPNTPVFICAALGGQGKTSLVSNWFQSEPRLRKGWEGVIWWSFYAPASLPDELARFALDKIARGFPETSPRQRFEQLLKELQEKNFLLILDGFERALRGYAGADATGSSDLDVELEADERSVTDSDFDWFLLRMVSTRSASKVLITTRDVPIPLGDREGCMVERLDVLTTQEALEYLRAADIIGEPHEFEKALEYGRHPLGLKLLKGLVAEDLEAPGDLKVLRRLKLPSELRDRDRRHHILEHAYRVMPVAARGLLERLSLYRTGIDYSKLQIFGKQFPLQKAVNDLVVRGFIDRKKDEKKKTFDLHPIVRQFAREHFSDTDREGFTAAHQLIADFYRRQTDEELRDEFVPMLPQDERYVGPRRDDADRIRSIDEITSTIELVHHLLNGGDEDRAIVTLRDRLSHLLVYKFAAFRILKDLLDPVFLGKRVTPRLPANDKQAWALNILANCYRFCVSACEAAVLHEIVVQWDEQQNNDNIFSVRLVNLAIDQQLIGDFERAEQNLLRSLEIARNSPGGNLVSYLRELGRLYTWLGRLSDAEIFLAEALKLARELGSRYERGALINHAHLLLAQGEPSRALEHAQAAEEVARKQGEQSLLEEKHAIALCRMASGTPKNREEAGRLLKEALDEAGRDGLATTHVQLLLALAQWSGPGRSETERLAEKARQIAVEGDYVPFEADALSALGEAALSRGDLRKAQEYGDLAVERSSQRKDPRTRDYLTIPPGSPFRYELGYRRATELLKRVAAADM